jgi:hypothetical protein
MIPNSARIVQSFRIFCRENFSDRSGSFISTPNGENLPRELPTTDDPDMIGVLFSGG